MRAGKLDRRIDIQRASETGRDAMNAPIVTWATIATVWASHTPDAAHHLRGHGGERLSGQTLAGDVIETFTIRYRSDLNVTDRIVFDGLKYDIQSIREVGRRQGQEIDATALAKG